MSDFDINLQSGEESQGGDDTSFGGPSDTSDTNTNEEYTCQDSNSKLFGWTFINLDSCQSGIIDDAVASQPSGDMASDINELWNQEQDGSILGDYFECNNCEPAS